MVRLGASYFGNRFISHAISDLNRMAASCDYVVHTVNEQDLTYHKAVLAKIFSESKKAGLEVWADPWGVGGVFGGETVSKFLLEHRDVWQVMSDGRVVPAACLNQPAWHSYIKEWILTVRDMGGDVIFWDEPHIAFDFESEWQGIYSCVCPVCQNLFRKKYGSDLPGRLDEASRLFRRWTMRRFLDDVMSFAHSKGLKNALCLYAYKGHAEYDRVWEEAASLKSLDILGCDPYWRWRGNKNPAEHVGGFSKHVVELAWRNNKETQIWIQAMRLPSGSESEIHQACQAAIDAKVSHLAAWSFDGGELLDPVLSERPKDVWKAVENVFSQIKKNR